MYVVCVTYVWCPAIARRLELTGGLFLFFFFLATAHLASYGSGLELQACSRAAPRREYAATDLWHYITDRQRSGEEEQRS